MNNSRKLQDEQQQLNQVRVEADPKPKFSLNFYSFFSNDWSENLILHQAHLLDDNVLISHHLSSLKWSDFNIRKMLISKLINDLFDDQAQNLSS